MLSWFFVTAVCCESSVDLKSTIEVSLVSSRFTRSNRPFTVTPRDDDKDGWQVTAVAGRVNPDAPAHVRLLYRVDAQRP